MVHMIQVICENPTKKAMLASSIVTVRVPQWSELSGPHILKGCLENIPGFADYIPDSWMRTDDKVPMPPDRAYLIAIAGTLATMWLKKSVTTATMMRQG